MTLKERCNQTAADWLLEHGPIPTTADLSSLLYSVTRPLQDDLRERSHRAPRMRRRFGSLASFALILILATPSLAARGKSIPDGPQVSVGDVCPTKPSAQVNGASPRRCPTEPQVGVDGVYGKPPAVVNGCRPVQRPWWFRLLWWR